MSIPVGRRACQQGECEPDHRTLAASVNCLLEHLPVGMGVSDVVGKLAGDYEIHASKKQLYDWGNAYREDSSVRVPLSVIDAVEDALGRAVVTEAMAKRRGGVFVALPKVDAGLATDVEQQKRAIKEFSEFLATESNDCDETERQGLEAVAAVLAIIAKRKGDARRREDRAWPQAVGAR